MEQKSNSLAKSTATLATSMRRTDPSFQFSDVWAFAPNVQAKKNIARNNAYIDRHSKEHEPTQEVYITIINNHKELSGLARPSFYP
jgi:hypothetical protein